MKAANAFDLSSFSIGHVDAEAVVAEELSVPSAPEEQQVALFMVRPFDSPEKVPVEQSEKICSLLSSCRLNRGVVMEGEWEFKGATLLWLAARHNNVVGARMLLEAGADVNARCLPNNWTTRFEAPIHTATRFNNVEVLRLLLAAPGVRVQRFKDDGATAIFLSMQEGHPQCFSLLVNAGADPNYRRFDGTPPLSMCVQHNNGELVRFMAKMLPSEDAQKKHPTVAVENPQDRFVPRSEAWLDWNVYDSRGVTPLVHAIANEYDDIVKVYCELPNTNFQFPSSFDLTALEYAVVYRKVASADMMFAALKEPPRLKLMRILNRLLAFPANYGWEEEGNVTYVRKWLRISFGRCRFDPFSIKEDDKKFFRGKDNEFWKIVNEFRIWDKTVHHLFPQSFKDVVMTVLLSFKRLAKTGLKFPIPREIQQDVIRYMSIGLLESMTPASAEEENPPPYYLDDMEEADAMDEGENVEFPFVNDSGDEGEEMSEGDDHDESNEEDD